jgi:predicted transcriptional regulator
MVTTIQLEEKTKEELERMRLFPRETYNEVIIRLIFTSQEESELSEQTIKNIEKALEDIKKGRLYTTEVVRKELGIK